MNKVAVIIPNGNMPEWSEKIYGHIKLHTKCEHDVIMVNNPITYSEGDYTINCADPIGMTPAILKGIEFADNKEDYFAYWICTTSIEFTEEKDYLTPMLTFMVNHPNAVMVSPATNDMAWNCMRQVQGSVFRRVWGVDNVCLLIRKDWFHSVDLYDAQLKIGWGTTLETCWKARRDQRDIIVMDNLLIKWHDGIAHKMDRRWGETREEHNNAGSKEMESIFLGRYGKDWLKRLNSEFKKGL